MGNAPSAPVPGTEFQVIGAGLSRTGTASFFEALKILLEGPVFHTGTEEDKKVVQRNLKNLMDGYAACTDAPMVSLVEELLESYPKAIVICTTRDKYAWEKSMVTLANAATMAFLKFSLLPIGNMRHFPYFAELMNRQWGYMYGQWTLPIQAEPYDIHIEYLKRGPLCKMLGKLVPKDIPFPRINDGEAVERTAKEMVMKGLKRWALMFLTLGLAVFLVRKYI
ncbi:hypothetical protein BCR34DRAFT_626216 [Clohesyomyces aquaticus]|uniref:P-loop containing nucleoside triphosphate hydrolase protein n=1 Tax=Clohesyomyces aquaticus TaxID=1231657 RepID=A0A1Y1ZDU7_9PLEO|nr:hypothetical protein BCR34DRAFT_626216 [Clohesyomyces aquaticus]